MTGDQANFPEVAMFVQSKALKDGIITYPLYSYNVSSGMFVILHTLLFEIEKYLLTSQLSSIFH